jgi:hypothetical protein
MTVCFDDFKSIAKEKAIVEIEMMIIEWYLCCIIKNMIANVSRKKFCKFNVFLPNFSFSFFFSVLISFLFSVLFSFSFLFLWIEGKCWIEK